MKNTFREDIKYKLMPILTDNFGDDNGGITVVWEPLNILEFVVINNIFPLVLGELLLTNEKVLPAEVTFKTGAVIVVTGDVELYVFEVDTAGPVSSVWGLSFLASVRFGRLVIFRNRLKASSP